MIVEDDRVDQMALTRALEKSGDPVTYEIAETLAEARSLISSRDFDCAIFDFHLPDGTVVEHLSRRQGEPGRARDLPIMVVTGAEGENEGVSSLQQGAQDYLLKKELSANGVRRAVRYAIARNKIARELEATIKRGEQADRLDSIGLLGGELAHDLNNKLAVVEGNTLAALEDLGDEHETTRVKLRKVLKATAHSVELIRQVLAFSRQQTMTPRPLDLSEAVADAATVLREVLRGAAPLELRLEPETTAYLDPRQLSRVLLNLITNARDALTQASNPRVILSVRSEGDEVVIEVEDNGAGIEPELLGRIYDPFFTTKDDAESTGLGLAVVHGIVSQSKGSILHRSQPGAGTRVVVRFPRAAGVGPQAKPPAGLARAGEASQRTILVVDDEEDLNELLAQILLREGYSVLTAFSAEEALEVYRDAPRIDLLFSDVRLPGMQGPELAKQLYALQPDLALVLISGFADSSRAVQDVVALGGAFEHKPVSRQRVLELAEVALGIRPDPQG
ncbi:MAG TPA: hypothetical protein DEA08_18575 [Planctomycetes bacterium]|nr:hypothetical protein [Planctomycetota bacterium]